MASLWPDLALILFGPVGVVVLVLGAAAVRGFRRGAQSVHVFSCGSLLINRVSLVPNKKDLVSSVWRAAPRLAHWLDSGQLSHPL